MTEMVERMRVELLESVLEPRARDEKLNQVGDDFVFIPAGMTGTVTRVTNIGVFVCWERALVTKPPLLPRWEWQVDPRKLRCVEIEDVSAERAAADEEEAKDARSRG